MRNFLAGLTFALLASVSPALAQRVVPPDNTINCAFNTAPPTVTTGQMVRVQCDNQGRLLITASPSGAATEVTASDASAMTTAGCTVGTSSAQCIAASAATRWIQVQNTHGTNSIACRWGGVAALNDPNSFMLQPGQSASWGLISSGVPNNALNCIASATTTPLYVELR